MRSLPFQNAISRRQTSAPVTELLEERKLFSVAPTPAFHVTNLVSDGAFPALHKDADLVNPWGISFGPGKEFWISDNGTGKTTLYDGDGVKQSLVVTIPGVGGDSSSPTGQVFNIGGSGFNITENGKTGSSAFIFVTEDGTISGWTPKVDLLNAVTVANDPNAIYKGVALAGTASNPELFATDFHQGKVDAFDKNFHKVALAAGAFRDASIPRGFAPFNVQNINGKLFVTFAKQDADKHDDLQGAFNGFVDTFDTNGKLLQRFQHGEYLNSPWGLAVAPKTFGKYAGDLLVGNFGSGKIVVYNMTSGKALAFLSGADGKTLREPGLWALSVGSGGPTESVDTLFFTAGPNDESDGLFGDIQIVVVAKG